MLCTTSNHPIAAADTQPLLLMLVHRPNAEKLHKPSPAILTLGLEPASESACAIAVVLPSRKHANWVRDNAYAGCVFSVTLPTTGASPNHPPPTSATPNPFLDAAPGTLVDPPTPTCLGLYLRTLRADAVLRLVREGDPMVEEHGGFRDTVEGWWVAGWNDGPHIPQEESTTPIHKTTPNLLASLLRFRKSRIAAGARKGQLAAVDALIGVETECVFQEWTEAVYGGGSDADGEGEEDGGDDVGESVEGSVDEDEE